MTTYTPIDIDCDCRACQTRRDVEFLTWCYAENVGRIDEDDVIAALSRHFAVVLGEV